MITQQHPVRQIFVLAKNNRTTIKNALPFWLMFQLEGKQFERALKHILGQLPRPTLEAVIATLKGGT